MHSHQFSVCSLCLFLSFSPSRFCMHTHKQFNIFYPNFIEYFSHKHTPNSRIMFFYLSFIVTHTESKKLLVAFCSACCLPIHRISSWFAFILYNSKLWKMYHRPILFCVHIIYCLLRCIIDMEWPR